MTEQQKTRIAPSTEKYQKAKSASGSMSMNNGDRVAVALVGLALAEVYELAAEIVTAEAKPVAVADLQAKYAHLNDGQQRMNLGNRIRGTLNRIDKNYDAAKAKGEEPGLSGDTYLATLVEPFRQAADSRRAAAEAEKAAKQAEREEKAAAEKAESAAVAETAEAE